MVESTVNVPAGGTGGPTALCPSGARVIGTGFDASVATVAFVRAYTTLAGGFFFNDSSIATDVSVQAICAPVGSAGIARTAGVGSGLTRGEFAADKRHALALHRRLG